MAAPRSSRPLTIRRYREPGWQIYGTVVTVLLLFITSQAWIAFDYKHAADRVEQRWKDLRANGIPDAKTRQEVIALDLEHERKRNYASLFLANVGAGISALVAVSGGWIALHQYLGIRRKERTDRAASDLSELWERIASDDKNVRAFSIAGLQHYLSPEMEEYHERVAAALALASRMENDELVQQTLMPVVEKAFRLVDPDVLRATSWQHAKLSKLNLAGAAASRVDLRSFDLRDAVLEDADLSYADLTGARLNAARINGARLDHALLTGANLSFADLAGTSLKQAVLQNADLNDAKLMDTDLTGTRLENVKFSWRTIDWSLARNWRASRMDAGVRKRLDAMYGPGRSGPRVLMLSWEFLPMVSGGGWTAVYHLVRTLRRAGSDISLMIPWPPSMLAPTDDNPPVFGNEVTVLAVGEEEVAASPPYGAYGAPTAPASPYAPSYGGIYGGPFYGPRYAAPAPYGYSVYGSPLATGVYGAAYSPYAAPTARSRQPRSLLSRIRTFRDNAVEHVRNSSEKYDVVHSHDWVTFEAAEAVAASLGAPWVAHFHSLEADRRAALPSSVARGIERRAVENANRIVTPSQATKDRLVREYGANPDMITVAPNCLSPEEKPVSPAAEFTSQRVIFLGRFSEQKGPDRFVELAQEVRRDHRSIGFAMYGGDLEPGGNWRIGSYAAGGPYHGTTDWFHYAPYFSSDVIVAGALPWRERMTAFDGASVLVVPSRQEPFGMVILEAMQQGVPVIYPKSSGAAEVLSAGIVFEDWNTREMAEQVVRLLRNEDDWQRVAAGQSKEIAGYPASDYAERIAAVWRELKAAPHQGVAAAEA